MFKSNVMTKRNLLSNYIKVFSFLFKVLLLFSFCALFALIVVTPLWKLAVDNPSLYSLFVGLIAVFFIFFIVIKKIRFFILSSSREERKIKMANSIRTILLLLLVLSSIVICILLVLDGYRFWGLVSLVLGLILYGIAAFVYKRK